MAINTEAIGKALCQTIDLIASKKVEDAGYDKTIPATIIECTDSTIGKYKVKYQDSIFYAFSENINTTYPNRSEVYISVPNGDMSHDKRIIGTVEKLGINYIPIISEDEQYTGIGNNCITNTSTEFKLNSYIPKQKIELYSAEKENNLLSVDKDGAKEYFSNSDSFTIGALFQTNFTKEQQSKGRYGIEVELVFGSDMSENNIFRKYIFSSDQMVGNPYLFTQPILQKKYFQIDGKNFVRINSISIFSENFPNQNSEKPDDIFIKNISLQATDRISEKELQEYMLSFLTVEGTVFSDSSSSEKNIVAQIRVKGKVIDSDSQNIPFYWFKENASINSTSEGYHQYGGAGWQCLNPKNIIDENTIETVPMTSNYLMKKENNFAENNIYKCVAEYGHILIENTINIKNISANYKTRIESSDGFNFFNDVGNFILTCNVDNIERPESLIYSWCEVTSDGTTIKLESGDTPNQTKRIQVNQITNHAIFKCSIFKGKILIGTASAKITNTLKADENYHLILRNGSQVFKYSENGISPTHKSLDRPQKLKPLSFDLYDPEGRKVEKNELVGSVSWLVPSEESMLEIKKETPLDKDVLIYDIKPTFRANYMNNNIQLVVNYKDRHLSAITDFTFIKEGDVGTNGTDYVCKIVPNTSGIEPYHSILTSYNGQDYTMNYNYKNGTFPFKAEIWKNGFLDTSDSNVEWSILGNETSELSFEQNQMNYKYNNNKSICNIIQAKYVTKEGKIIYGSLPIITSKIESSKYKIIVSDMSGLKSITYHSDGTRPIYDTNTAFDVRIYKDNEQIEDLSSYTFTWEILGTSEIENKKNLVIKEKNHNIVKIEPTNKIYGFHSDNALYCKITKGTALIAELRIPINMHINKYESTEINDWDGNAIKVNDDTFLSPQIGAGIKNNDNTFTGVVMGTQQKKLKQESGLLGYSKGQRSIFLDANSGKAEFGTIESGKIILDPNNSLKISSSNFNTLEGTGMEIDLKEPSITYGSGNFSVDKDGYLKCKNANFEGNIKSTSGTIAGMAISEKGFKNNFLELGENDNRNGINFIIKDIENVVRIQTSHPSNSGFWAEAHFNDFTEFTVSSNDIILDGSTTLGREKTATSSSASNCYIDGNGVIHKTSTTSTKRHKKDISNTLDNDLNPQALYDVNIVQFKYKDEYQPIQEDCRHNKNLIGFIAEDIYDKYKIASDYHTEEGKDIVDGWNAQYMIPAMLQLIQEQKKEIDSIKQDLKILKNKMKT